MCFVRFLLSGEPRIGNQSSKRRVVMGQTGVQSIMKAALKPISWLCTKSSTIKLKRKLWRTETRALRNSMILWPPNRSNFCCICCLNISVITCIGGHVVIGILLLCLLWFVSCRSCQYLCIILFNQRETALPDICNKLSREIKWCYQLLLMWKALWRVCPCTDCVEFVCTLFLAVRIVLAEMV